MQCTSILSGSCYTVIHIDVAIRNKGQSREVLSDTDHKQEAFTFVARSSHILTRIQRFYSVLYQKEQRLRNICRRYLNFDMASYMQQVTLQEQSRLLLYSNIFKFSHAPKHEFILYFQCTQTKCRMLCWLLCWDNFLWCCTLITLLFPNFKGMRKKINGGQELSR